MSFTEHNTVEQVILNATTSLGSGSRNFVHAYGLNHTLMAL